MTVAVLTVAILPGCPICDSFTANGFMFITHFHSKRYFDNSELILYMKIKYKKNVPQFTYYFYKMQEYFNTSSNRSIFFALFHCYVVMWFNKRLLMFCLILSKLMENFSLPSSGSQTFISATQILVW
ncbi:unnamed protein product [Clavelina lepadiformis]|uniref:Uncharacterized protein n=1 Tax=Clavelina lepadiformis TaxID=159417 RepID=A0ABP0GWJ0_CLALP